MSFWRYKMERLLWKKKIKGGKCRKNSLSCVSKLTIDCSLQFALRDSDFLTESRNYAERFHSRSVSEVLHSKLQQVALDVLSGAEWALRGSWSCNEKTTRQWRVCCESWDKDALVAWVIFDLQTKSALVFCRAIQRAITSWILFRRLQSRLSCEQPVRKPTRIAAAAVHVVSIAVQHLLNTQKSQVIGFYCCHRFDFLDDCNCKAISARALLSNGWNHTSASPTNLKIWIFVDFFPVFFLTNLFATGDLTTLTSKPFHYSSWISSTLFSLAFANLSPINSFHSDANPLGTNSSNMKILNHRCLDSFHWVHRGSLSSQWIIFLATQLLNCDDLSMTRDWKLFPDNLLKASVELTSDKNNKCTTTEGFRREAMVPWRRENVNWTFISSERWEGINVNTRLWFGFTFLSELFVIFRIFVFLTFTASSSALSCVRVILW